MNFYTDAMKFLGIMAIVAIIGFATSIHVCIKYFGGQTVFYRSINLITITVPPALPAAMNMGIVFALARLRKKQIYCISPPKINVAGRVRTIVFDKTGTLTEEGLNLAGLRCIKSQYEFHPLVENTTQLFPNNEPWWESKSHYQNVKQLHRLKLLE